MKVTLDAVKRVAGNTESERKTAMEFCAEALAEAELRFAHLRKLREGEVLLNEECLRVARDSVAGLRHLYSMIRQLVDFHGNGQLNGTFVAVDKEVTRMKEQGERILIDMHALYPGDTR